MINTYEGYIICINIIRLEKLKEIFEIVFEKNVSRYVLNNLYEYNATRIVI